MLHEYLCGHNTTYAQKGKNIWQYHHKKGHSYLPFIAYVLWGDVRVKYTGFFAIFCGS